MPSASSVASGVLFTTLTMGTLGLSRGGFSVNHMDIAPKYAGVVMGISNTAGECPGCCVLAAASLLCARMRLDNCPYMEGHHVSGFHVVNMRLTEPAHLPPSTTYTYRQIHQR